MPGHAWQERSSDSGHGDILVSPTGIECPLCPNHCAKCGECQGGDLRRDLGRESTQTDNFKIMQRALCNSVFAGSFPGGSFLER